MRDLINLIENAEGLEVKIMAGRDTLHMITDNDLQSVVNQIKYFDYQEASREIHVVVFLKGEIVAMGGFQINPDDPKHLWVKFISTRPLYRQLGYARMIYRAIYEWASERDLKIAPGGLTQDGARMAHIHDEMHARYPNTAMARDAAGNYLNDRGQIVRSGDLSPGF